MDKSKSVIIRSFYKNNEALMCQSLLESSGIRCELIGNTISSILPLENEAMEIHLTVLEADVEKAESILVASFDQEEFDSESNKRRKKP